MNKIIDEIENEINYNDLLLEFSRKDKTDIPTAIAYSTVDSANRINANAIVCSTMTGLTAKKISHFRPSAPVIAISPIEKTVSGLTINYGIMPMKVPMLESTDEIIEKSTSVAKEALNLQKKDRIVIAGSFPLNVEYTNFLRIEEIKEWWTLEINKELLIKAKEDIIKKYMFPEEKKQIEEEIKEEIDKILLEFEEQKEEEPIDE